MVWVRSAAWQQVSEPPKQSENRKREEKTTKISKKYGVYLGHVEAREVEALGLRRQRHALGGGLGLKFVQRRLNRAFLLGSQLGRLLRGALSGSSRNRRALCRRRRLQGELFVEELLLQSKVLLLV